MAEERNSVSVSLVFILVKLSSLIVLGSKMWNRRILLVLFIVLLAWAYQYTCPPPPKICGSPGGSPITAPRIKLWDGRHLAYKEHGVPKEVARYKIIYFHGFSSCRQNEIIVTKISPELVQELGVYVVTFDRPGYGESDPDPKRTVKSLALDMEDLADQLGLGSRFYVIGLSMGGQVVWSCLKYIPYRLAGAALIAPVVNYWWPGFTANLSTAADYNQPLADQWDVRVAHHIPWLTHWWNTQKFFPASSAITHNPEIFSPQDVEILKKISDTERNKYKPYEVKQQGEFESMHRDLIVGFGSWEFDPMDLEDPFKNNEGSVHLWHGDDDRLVPVTLQRYIASKLPRMHYHEIPGSGHFFVNFNEMIETILKALIVGEKK